MNQNLQNSTICESNLQIMNTDIKNSDLQSSIRKSGSYKLQSQINFEKNVSDKNILQTDDLGVFDTKQHFKGFFYHSETQPKRFGENQASQLIDRPLDHRIESQSNTCMHSTKSPWTEKTKIENRYKLQNIKSNIIKPRYGFVYDRYDSEFYESFCSYKNKRKMSSYDFFKRQSTISLSGLSKIPYKAISENSLDNLRKYCVNMFIYKYSPEGYIKRFLSYCKNSCYENPHDYISVEKNPTLLKVSKYVADLGPIPRKKWEETHIMDLQNESLQLLLTLIHAKADINFRFFDPVMIYCALIIYVRHEMEGLMDFNVLTRSIKILTLRKDPDYKNLAAFRDLTFDQKKRNILNSILLFLQTQLRNRETTGFTQNLAEKHLRLAMLPFPIEDRIQELNPSWNYVWIENLLDQGRVDYVPCWIFDYDITLNDPSIKH